MIPIKESRVYLGTVLAYRRRQDLNISHRISSAQNRYQQIRKVLNGRGPLATRWRLRLWSACIQPCLLYSVELGARCQVFRNFAFWPPGTSGPFFASRYICRMSPIKPFGGVPNPGPLEQTIRDRICSQLDKRGPELSQHGPDIVSNEQVVQQLRRLVEELDSHIRRLTVQGLSPPQQMG